jgi:RNA polymerase sigma-70 factor (ECF subfamily)
MRWPPGIASAAGRSHTATAMTPPRLQPTPQDAGPASAAGTAATRELFARIYEELHAIAHRCMRGERGEHTLQATAVVHEVFLRLVRSEGTRWSDPDHLLAVAARTVRRILVNHALARRTQRRGGGRPHLPFDDSHGVRSGLPEYELIALGDALEELERLDLRQARLVELRFFGGLGTAEIARVLGVSPRTVEGDWSLARAWLRRRMAQGNDA